MMKRKLLSMALSLGLVTNGHAALLDRGGGLIYDEDLNITWLQDANYAKTSGYDVNAIMIWTDAVTWADNLSYFDSVRNVTYSDWRLPSSDKASGYNITDSEMGHLFYQELGGSAFSSITTTHNANYDLFINIQNSAYWSGTDYQQDPWFASYFGMNDGSQYAGFKLYALSAWAVRDGDVAAIPEPAVLLLLGLGMVGLVIARRR